MKVKRDTEINLEYESRKSLPRIKIPTPMLQQVSSLYTPAIFEAFQTEYGRSMAASAHILPGDNEYMVKIGRLVDGQHATFEQQYKVVGDNHQQTTSCSCGKFERVGILRAHALEVLELMNIKLFLSHHILK